MKFVEFALENNGYKTLEDKEKVFEMKIMSSTRFFYIAREIEAKGIQDGECVNNFDGSSPAMETEGWMKLWKRSVEKCNFRYTTVISDGDSKAYSSAKRVGKALRDCVQEKSRKGEGVGGRRRGSLTQVTLGKIQDFYRYAIIPNLIDVEKMNKAIFAIIEHCCSTDDDPCHELCPEGVDSAQGEGKPILEALTNIFTKQYVKISRVTDLYHIMRKYSTDELLSRCTGRTQNANEGLNSVIWSKCSKTVLYQKERVHYLIAKAITEFNFGFVPSGKIRKNIGTGQDVKTHKLFERRQEKKEERKSKKRKSMEEEAKKVTKESTTYEAGAF
ncbi:hypothetical protein Pmani_016559 [Petrolisthes manimaculis]|uniref:Mutator-like transposase domain-containing protein n=1 Tax=Petrolisthes manimaculis TaxID=1843537 RepID=A0AAE1PP63_9EUCA|nr:hypothetical protein Pmani_016559 [Petrolisthes manimaculis]